MVDLDDLTDWDKLGLSWAATHWQAVQYFRAPLSIRKLENLGLIETKVENRHTGTRPIKIETFRLTDAGLELQAQIKASDFNPHASIKRSA